MRIATIVGGVAANAQGRGRMCFHRLLEAREIDGRVREAGALIDYRGPPVGHFEPLDVADHGAWIEAMRWRGSFPDESRAAA